MPTFDSGVAGYVEAYATVKVHFPIDFRGNRHINCDQCRYYSRNGRICHLNKEIVEFPEKFVGSNCPLENFEVKEF